MPTFFTSYILEADFLSSVMGLCDRLINRKDSSLSLFRMMTSKTPSLMLLLARLMLLTP
jgi:hypothetical protein